MNNLDRSIFQLPCLKRLLLTRKRKEGKKIKKLNALIKSLKQQDKNRVGSDGRLRYAKLPLWLDLRRHNNEIGSEWLKACNIIRKTFKVKAVQTATFTTGHRHRIIPALLVLHIINCVHELKNAYKSARLLLCLQHEKKNPFTILCLSVI